MLFVILCGNHILVFNRNLQYYRISSILRQKNNWLMFTKYMHVLYLLNHVFVIKTYIFKRLLYKNCVFFFSICRQLSDLNRDGELSLEEFCIAMHLVVLRRHEIEIPDRLPFSLMPYTSFTNGKEFLYY